MGCDDERAAEGSGWLIVTSRSSADADLDRFATARAVADAVLYEGATGDSRPLKAARGDQRRYYVALREALHRRAPNRVPPEQGATVMAIIEAGFRSEREGCRAVPDLTEAERTAWVTS